MYVLIIKSIISLLNINSSFEKPISFTISGIKCSLVITSFSSLVNGFVSIIVILSLKIVSILPKSLNENTINALERSKGIPAKYLSSKLSFCVESVK